MSALATVTGVVIWGLLITFVAVVCYQLLTGRINTSGMLSQKDHSGRYSPARVQALVVTLASAFYLLFQVVSSPQPHTFPTIPDAWLVILGGSHLGYLGSKAYTMLLRR